jgi:hypothetical protein
MPSCNRSGGCLNRKPNRYSATQGAGSFLLSRVTDQLVDTPLKNQVTDPSLKQTFWSPCML